MDMKETVGLSDILCQVELRDGFCNSVLARIAKARRRAARLRLAFQSLVCFASGAALVPLAQFAGRELFDSGFYDYISMILSPRGLAILSWQDIVYSLIESLPSMILLLMLACVIALVWSLRSVVRDSRIAFMSPQI
jgi:hypothetical protein